MRSKVYDISDDEFKNIIKKANGKKDALRLLGYNNTGGYALRLLEQRCQECGIDTSRWKRGHKRTKTVREYKDDEVFVENSSVTQNAVKRHFLLRHDIPYVCSKCGQPPYHNGIELVLRLDHVNGNNTDDRIDNLRWLCPNCDSQERTFCGRNKYIEEDDLHER